MNRCRLCGITGYEPSLGGPTICPACDCGNFHDKDLATKRMLGLKPPPKFNERCPFCHGRGTYTDLADPYHAWEVYCTCEAGRDAIGAGPNFEMDVEDFEVEPRTAWSHILDEKESF